MVLHQDLGERHPHVAGIAKSVQQKDRRSVAAKADVLRAAADRHLLAMKNSGPRPAACHGSSPMNCRVSIAGFAATSKALEAYGAGRRDAAGEALLGIERNGPKRRQKRAGAASPRTNGHSRQWHGKLSETG